jgi:hypothetical protein
MIPSLGGVYDYSTTELVDWSAPHHNNVHENQNIVADVMLFRLLASSGLSPSFHVRPARGHDHTMYIQVLHDVVYDYYR